MRPQLVTQLRVTERYGTRFGTHPRRARIADSGALSWVRAAWQMARSGRGRGWFAKYPRYMFTNRSNEILALFADACVRLGIESRQMNRWNLAISKQKYVAVLDELVGPKS